MLYNGNSEKKIDPMEEFYSVLYLTWDKITRQFDVQAELPEVSALLEDVEPFDPCMAAETIIRNMLTEITQMVHRFSPWFKLPARSYGLVSFRDILTHRNEWRLAPEAIEKWQDEIEVIAAEIEKKHGIIQVMMFVSNVQTLEQSPKDAIIAVCDCEPPVELLIVRNFLESRDIVCKECHAVFVAQLA